MLALCSVAVCDENRNVSETRIIPVQTLINFPKTHERIIVPIDPVEAVEVIEKPVKEPASETNFRKRKPKHVEEIEVSTEKPRQLKRNPKNYDDGKGNYHNSYSYAKRNDNPRSVKEANSIQPLNINTKIFKNTTPKNTPEKPSLGKYQSRIRGKSPEQIHELKNMVKDSRKKIMPAENPEDIPATSWFDNTGKYNYGIIHHGEYVEPEAYKDDQVENGKTVIEPKVFKSSFRDPSAHVEHKASGKNLGNFLYKSEVFYPSYRDNLYPPVITYGDPAYEAKPATKELPTTNLHKSPPVTKTPKKEETPQKSHKPPTPQKPLRPKETEKQAPAEENDEDYEDDDSGDYEDPGNNDKYDGEAPGNDDDEGSEDDEEESDDSDDKSDDRSDDRSDSESDEKSDDESFGPPKYRYAYEKGSDSASDEESDEFERSWAKFGYGPKKANSRSDEEEEEESGSYESAETQVAPQRIKYYHEKREQVTTPLFQSTTKAPVLIKKIRKVARSMSGSLNNSKPKAVAPKVKSQEDKSQPADDLKYFQ